MPPCGKTQRPSFLSVVPKDNVTFYRAGDDEPSAKEPEMYGQGRSMESMQGKAPGFAVLGVIISAGVLGVVGYYGGKMVLGMSIAWPLG